MPSRQRLPPADLLLHDFLYNIYWCPGHSQFILSYLPIKFCESFVRSRKILLQPTLMMVYREAFS